MALDNALRQQLRGGSAISITELTPPGPGLIPRVLILGGPALPFQGAEWGGENNVITTWYPGNGAEGTQQNLGPRELPSAWEGSWKRTQLGANPVLYYDELGKENRIVSPHLLREIVESIARAGARLRVVWSSQQNMVDGSTTGSVSARLSSDSIVREGRIKSWKFPHNRLTDIRWNLEFHWVSRGGSSKKIADLREDTDVANIASGIEASINALMAATIKKKFEHDAAIVKSSSTLTLGQLEAIAKFPTELTNTLLRKLQQNVSRFKRVGSIVRTLRSQPQQAVQATLDFAHNTSAVSRQFADDMAWRPAETMSTKDRVSSMLTAYVFVAGVVEESVHVARKGKELEEKAKRFSTAAPAAGQLTVKDTATNSARSAVAIHICKDGETPTSISKKYYGVPDHAVDILRANRMPWHTVLLDRGKILVIPTLTNQSAAT